MEQTASEQLKQTLAEVRHAECVIRDALEDCVHYHRTLMENTAKTRQILEVYLTHIPEPKRVE